MFSQEAIAIVGAALSILLAITGFLSAQAFARVTRELDGLRAEATRLAVRLARLEAVCATRHQGVQGGD